MNKLIFFIIFFIVGCALGLVFFYTNIFVTIIFLFVIFLFLSKRINKNKELKQKEDEKMKIEKTERLNNKINEKFKKVDILNHQLLELQNIEIYDVSDFKKFIVENEAQITKKGGDSLLFSFLKVDSFLNDFHKRILSDQIGLKNVLDVESLKNKIKSETERNDLDKISERLNDMVLEIDGKNPVGFDASIDKLFELGNLMKPTMESQIQTLEFYKNIAFAMIIFYLNDKKIRYFEIYEAFEKLGVFDSTWQKKVLNKLDRIEIRLAHISNQLTELNQNFESLAKSSENIANELKEINSGIVSNNLLTGITAYQTWKLNKKLK